MNFFYYTGMDFLSNIQIFNLKKITNLGHTFKNKIKLRYCFHNFSDSEGKYHNE